MTDKKPILKRIDASVDPNRLIYGNQNDEMDLRQLIRTLKADIITKNKRIIKLKELEKKGMRVLKLKYLLIKPDKLAYITDIRNLVKHKNFSLKKKHYMIIETKEPHDLECEGIGECWCRARLMKAEKEYDLENDRRYKRKKKREAELQKVWKKDMLIR